MLKDVIPKVKKCTDNRLILLWTTSRLTRVFSTSHVIMMAAERKLVSSTIVGVPNAFMADLAEKQTVLAITGTNQLMEEKIRPLA
jgi:hypothetical protein